VDRCVDEDGWIDRSDGREREFRKTRVDGLKEGQLNSTQLNSTHHLTSLGRGVVFHSNSILAHLSHLSGFHSTLTLTPLHLAHLIRLS
jgi:hypothetical protein